jgi:2-polyprenylphenol hydroxylase and related flavodoxin oxidoreductases
MKDAHVTATRPTGAHSVYLTLELADSEASFTGQPGHHTVVSKPESEHGRQSAMPYSVMKLGPTRIMLLVRGYEDGNVSAWITDRVPGDTVSVRTDLSGNLTLQSADRPAVFMASGTGITPMVGLLDQYLEGGGSDATVILGDKRQETLLGTELLEFLGTDSAVDIEYVLSRESWAGREGYAQEHLSEIFDEIDDSRDYYICGVPPMVNGTKDLLAGHDVSEEAIITEGWE